MGKLIIKFLKAIWKFFFVYEKKEHDPEVIKAKREAIEKFCETQNKDCFQCWVYYEIPWYDECHYSDEEVEFTYWLLYGDKDPKE